MRNYRSLSPYNKTFLRYALTYYHYYRYHYRKNKSLNNHIRVVESLSWRKKEEEEEEVRWGKTGDRIRGSRRGGRARVGCTFMHARMYENAYVCKCGMNAYVCMCACVRYKWVLCTTYIRRKIRRNETQVG